MKIIYSEKAPEPIGPYSQAVEMNGFIFSSGQIAIDPSNGEIVSEKLEDQTRQVIKNLQSVLISAGSDLNKVVKTTIFITDMNNFAMINNIYAEFFGKSKPARSTVEVSRLPKNVLIEIDCIATI